MPEKYQFKGLQSFTTQHINTHVSKLSNEHALIAKTAGAGAVSILDEQTPEK